MWETANIKNLRRKALDQLLALRWAGEISEAECASRMGRINRLDNRQGLRGMRQDPAYAQQNYLNYLRSWKG